MEVIQNIYLCYGNEEYTKNKYVDNIKKKLIDENYEIMNLEIYEGKNIAADQIIDSAETMPFMSEYRLLIVKDSGFFKSGKKDESAKISEYIDKVPSSTCIIFMETDIDKRTALYKKINKKYKVLEFKPLSDNELMLLVKDELEKSKINMKKSTMEYFISIIPEGVENLLNELQKLINFKSTGEILIEDIDNICTKSLDIRIFELVKMLGTKNTKKAIEIYHNLLEMKESPIGILAMISRQFRMIFKVKYLSQKGLSTKDIATRTGFRFFMITDSQRQGNNFTFKQLESAINECLIIDEGIKTGKISPELGVELLIIKYSSK